MPNRNEFAELAKSTSVVAAVLVDGLVKLTPKGPATVADALSTAPLQVNADEEVTLEEVEA
jgi:hypothetical protein